MFPASILLHFFYQETYYNKIQGETSRDAGKLNDVSHVYSID